MIIPVLRLLRKQKLQAMLSVLAVIPVLICSMAGAALAQGANVHCSAPMRSDWLSWLEVENRVKGRGMRLVRLRINDEKCLNVLAIDGHGQYMALLMHPVSGEVLGERNQPDPHSNKTVPWKVRKEP